MEDYKLVTQRIINKGEHILAEKRRRKKRMTRFALTASTICGSVCLCIGAAAMWNSVIRPELDKSTPEINMSVTTRTTTVSQSDIHTKASDSTATKAVTTAPEKETKKAVTSTVPVTNAYEYTEPLEVIVTEISAETIDIQTQTEAVQTTAVSKTTIVTTSESEAKAVSGYTDAQKNGKPIIEIGGYVYTFNGVYLTKKETESFYIAWTEEVQIGYPDINPDKAELAEVMGLSDKESPQEFVIVYFPKRDSYALYEAS